nr:hypothetical protein [Mesorhizobium sp. M1B.F.Ca.ET.045.04.1.1]
MEIRNTLVEGYRSATGNQTVFLSFRTLAEGTEPAKVAVAAGLEQEYVELMVGDADAHACLEGLSQRGGSRAAQLAEPMLRVDPHRQIEIAALVPDLDARAAEFAEPGTSFQSGFATDPMTAIASISGNAIQDCVTTSAAWRNSRWRRRR